MSNVEKVVKALEEVIAEAVYPDRPRKFMMPLELAEDALALLKAQEPVVAYWIPCNGKSHIWYCSNCGEKINYNNAHKVYAKGMKPIEEVNRYCRNCGAKMDGERRDSK